MVSVSKSGKLDITWVADYETGNKIVDNDHKQIFELVKKVLDNAFENRTEKVNTSIEFLAQYVLQHFANEEKLMDESNYPEAATHKALHSAFVKSVVALQEKVKKEGDTLNIGMEINTTVIGWLMDHVLGRDKLLAGHYKEWQKAQGK